MTNPNLLYLGTRPAWRQWLSENYGSAGEAWLVYPRRHTGRPRVVYNDAVEEALCFGWIDSITRTIDEDHYSQRFTPRKQGSRYSQTNIERLRRLIELEQLMPEILEAVRPVVAQSFAFPTDIRAALEADPEVWQIFQSYSGAYRRIRVAYVESRRKKPAEFKKRLDHLIKMTKQNKQFGFGIEAYY